jgi:multicomponent Na+:H+ antiporter subunit B
MNAGPDEAAETTSDPPERTGTETTVIARTSTRLVVPIILLTAIALLLQGHNLPGGGFIAGVLTVTAFALIYIVFGADYVQSELLAREPVLAGSPEEGIQKDFASVVALGLALAVGGGLAAVVLGYPFLTQAVAFVYDVPLFVEIELASALVFDLGVYAVVVGGLLTILTVVGSQ